MKVRKDDIEDKYVSLRIAAAISVIAGAWSLIFEVYFFKSFTIEIYLARVIFTVIASYDPCAVKLNIPGPGSASRVP